MVVEQSWELMRLPYILLSIYNTNKAGRRLFDHVIAVLVKVEFIDLTYMIEEHIPLNNPDHYPIYVINQFPDITGSRWLLKTLLSSKGFTKSNCFNEIFLSINSYLKLSVFKLQNIQIQILFQTFQY